MAASVITGVGTGGHIKGVAEVLKPRRPGLKVYAVEPTPLDRKNRLQQGTHKVALAIEAFDKPLIAAVNGAAAGAGGRNHERPRV